MMLLSLHARFSLSQFHCYSGRQSYFADVELDSQNISRRTIEAVITPNTKAIICVHLAGWMCDMDPIMQLAEKKASS